MSKTPFWQKNPAWLQHEMQKIDARERGQLPQLSNMALYPEQQRFDAAGVDDIFDVIEDIERVTSGRGIYEGRWRY